MFELGHAPVYYVPAGDVRMDLMTPTDEGTHCPYKGDASYWSLTVGGTTVENIIWAYEDPYGEMAHLKGYVGVYWDRVDAWYHGETRVEAPVEIAGRVTDQPLQGLLPAPHGGVECGTQPAHRRLRVFRRKQHRSVVERRRRP